jgi:hypothetical protein
MLETLREALDDRHLILGASARFAFWFSVAVLVMGRYYRNWALAAVALGIGIIAGLCYLERRRHAEQAAALQRDATP